MRVLGVKKLETRSGGAAMTIGDVLSWVVVGFVFIWAFDVLHIWDVMDSWLERRGIDVRRLT